MPTVHNKNVVNGVPRGLDPGKGHGVSNPQGQFFNQRPALGSSDEGGIYNVVGDLDGVPEERYEEHQIDLEDDQQNDIDRFDLDGYLDHNSAAKMNRLVGQSGHVASPDFLGYNKRDRFYATPVASGPGHTTMVANNNIEGSLIFEEFLKEYIFEVLNENGGPPMSVNYHLNKAGHSGKLHPKGSLGPPTSPASKSWNARRITNIKGTASGTNAYDKLHYPDENLTDVEELENKKGNTTFFASNLSFGENGKIYEDELNVSKYNASFKV